MRVSTSTVAAVLAVLAPAACTPPAPQGFSGFSGAPSDRWTFPLVGPLEDGLLITPVTLNTHGPFLFLIDPDAPTSVVDAELVKGADLQPIAGPPRIDETGAPRAYPYAELVGLEIGTLIVEQRVAMVVPRHAFDLAGRRIHGVLGRDVIADSLVFGFDRDRGLAHLVLETAFHAPAGAAALPYVVLEPRLLGAKVPPVPRRLVSAAIGGEAFPLHVDLGAVPSQLREELWDRAKLVPRDVETTAVDEAGTRRAVQKGSEPAPVTAGAITASAAFIPYGDTRWEAQEVAGTLGLGFFAGHAVWADWPAHSLLLVGRAPVDAAARLARWDSPVLAKCKNLGCVQVRVVDPLGGKPPEEGKPHPGLVLSIEREEPAGGMDLEVVLEAPGTPGAPRLPLLIVNLPQHIDRLIHQLRPEFLGAQLAVVDASPHPRPCPGGDGCVDQIAR